MSASRLFSPQPLRSQTELVLGKEQARYIGRVLRLQQGDEVVLFDGSGAEYPATITSISRERVGLLVQNAVTRSVESPLDVRLVQGVSRGERMDIVVQKATELGVTRVVPVLTENGVVKLDADRSRKREAHWQRIAISACEQCGRNVVPKVDAIQPLADWLAEPSRQDDTRIVLDPASPEALTSIASSKSHVTLLVGPEGGLSEVEYRQSQACGYVRASFGPRILRTETAAIAAVCAVQIAWGDC